MTCGGIFFKMTGLLRREVFQDMSIIKKLSVFILFNFFLPSFHKNSFIFSSFFKEKQRERQEIQRDRDSVVSGFKLQICCFTHAHEFSMCSNHKVSGLPLKYLNINKNLHCGSWRDRVPPHGHTTWLLHHRYSCRRWCDSGQTWPPRCRLL